MTYPAHCGDEAGRIPTHCGTFIDSHPYGVPAEPAPLVHPEPQLDEAPLVELPTFGGPLFEGLLGNEIVGF